MQVSEKIEKNSFEIWRKFDKKYERIGSYKNIIDDISEADEIWPISNTLYNIFFRDFLKNTLQKNGSKNQIC